MLAKEGDAIFKNLPKKSPEDGDNIAIPPHALLKQ